ncbi:MAG: methylated-DNA--[protein]-cysteine S-methyltransferase [Brevinematia bacterium]
MQKESFYISKNGIGIEFCIEGSFISSISLKPAKTDFFPSVKSDSFSELIKMLSFYLDGKNVDFSLYLDKLFWQKCSSFQKKVYEALSKVKFGQYISYEELAKTACSGNYARAVGNAMSRNPFPLIIPCHRVLPKSFPMTKKLGGFSCGLELKEKLLMIEKIL